MSLIPGKYTITNTGFADLVLDLRFDGRILTSNKADAQGAVWTVQEVETQYTFRAGAFAFVPEDTPGMVLIGHAESGTRFVATLASPGAYQFTTPNGFAMQAHGLDQAVKVQEADISNAEQIWNIVLVE